MRRWRKHLKMRKAFLMFKKLQTQKKYLEADLQMQKISFKIRKNANAKKAIFAFFKAEV